MPSVQPREGQANLPCLTPRKGSTRWRRAALGGLVAVLGASAGSARAETASLIANLFAEPLGRPASGPSGGLVVGGLAYFAASDPQHGQELWVSDGTAAGTRVLDLCPGACGSYPHGFGRVGGLALFGAYGEAEELALWLSDGTAEGSRVLRPLCERCSVGVRALGTLGSRFLFSASASDGEHGAEPWASDGTAAGTRMLRDVMPGPTSSYPFQLVEVGGRAFVLAGSCPLRPECVLRTDGTPAGTVLAREIVSGGRTPCQLFAASSQLLLATKPGFCDQSSEPYDLIAMPSTLGSQTLLASDLQLFSFFAEAAGGVLFVAATSTGHGLELWVTDGSAKGTRRIVDFHPGPLGAGIQALAPAPGGVVFTADDSVHGREPFVLPWVGRAPGRGR